MGLCMDTLRGAENLSFTFAPNIVMQSSHSQTSSSSLPPTASDVSPARYPFILASDLIRQHFSRMCAMESTAMRGIERDSANLLSYNVTRP